MANIPSRLVHAYESELPVPKEVSVRDAQAHVKRAADAIISLRRRGETPETYDWHIKALMGHIRVMVSKHAAHIEKGDVIRNKELFDLMLQFEQEGVFRGWDGKNKSQIMHFMSIVANKG